MAVFPNLQKWRQATRQSTDVLVHSALVPTNIRYASDSDRLRYESILTQHHKPTFQSEHGRRS